MVKTDKENALLKLDDTDNTQGNHNRRYRSLECIGHAEQAWKYMIICCIMVSQLSVVTNKFVST